MDSYRFVDLVDVPGLQALMDAFYKASGIPVGILDNESNILVATGWQDICTKYHRVNPQTEALCKVSDAYIKANLKVGEYIEYKCQNHMWDLATPIVVKGQHVATLFLGQFFYDDESVNIELFRKQARKYGFPEKEYLEALRKVPIFSRQKVKDIMDYYTRFVHSLIDTALAHAELKEYQANLEGIVSERTTELSKAMGALRESEERYRETFHSSKAVKLLIDPDTGKIFDANKAACAFYGYSFKELTAKYIYEINTLTHDEIQKEMEAARNETRGHFNFRHRLASGETKDVEVYSSPITIGGKAVLHSIIHDVSARKRAENHLRLRADLSDISSSSSLDELIQAGLDMAERMTSSQIGFFHFVEDDQENLTLQTWSSNTLKNMCKAEGKGAHYPISKAGVWVDCFYEKKPIIHNDYASLTHKKGIPEGHAPVIRELVAPVIRGGKVVAILGVGNKETDYIQDDVEIVAEIGSSLIDFAQRKRAEEALKNSENLFRAIFEKAPVGVALIDSRTNKFLRINDKFCKIVKYSQEELLEISFPKITHPDDLQADLDNMDRLKSGEIPVFSMEKRYYRKDGAIVWVNLTVVPLWGSGALKDEGYHFAIVEDITARKKMEMERERLFSMPLDMICIVGMDGYFKKINPAFTKTLGFSEKELLEKPFMEFVHPDDHQQTMAEMERLSKGGVTQEFENRYLCKDGSWRWLAWKAVPVMGEGILYATARDITERKRMEEKIIASQNELSKAQEVAHLGSWELNLHTGKQTWSDELYRIYGYEPGSFEPTFERFMEVVHPEDRKTIEGYYPEILAGRLSRLEFDFRVIRPDGKEMVIHDKMEVINDKDNKPIKLVGVNLDITEIKRAEEELRKSEKKLQLMVENAPFVVGVSDTQGKIYFVNKRHEEIFGYPLEKIPTVADWLKLAYPDEKYRKEVEAQWSDDIRRVQSGELPTGPTRLYRITAADGKVKDVEISFSLTGDYMYVLFYDVSELKLAQENLRKAKEEAENATKLKDKFVSLVSHDLKGPLSSMLGLLSMAVTEDQSLDAKQKLDVIRAAISSGERMRSIIEDLLGVSRLRAGIVKLEMAFVNPYVVAGNAISEIREMADKKGIEFRNDIPVISRIYADQALLEEVMRNILSNAIKFCHPGGKVRIYQPQGELSTIAVADDGIGIPPEKIEKLFSYEEKISTPGTSGEMGTGLGLPLCEGIMETMGGKIRAESAVGKGSVFYVSLPYVRPVVMVVDDDPVQVMLITTMLNNLQVDFAMAYSGMEALKIVEAKAPHLVIADIMMTGMDGFDLMGNIRKKPGFEKIPVILITSHGSIETRNAAFQRGANDFITKPLMADELIPRVRRFIW